jgi:hypothetical protein
MHRTIDVPITPSLTEYTRDVAIENIDLVGTTVEGIVRVRNLTMRFTPRRQVADKVRCQMSPLVIRSPSRKVLLTGLRLQSRRRRKHCILAVHCWACNLGQQQRSKLPRVSRSREGTVVPLDLPQKRWLMLKSSGFFLVGNLVVVMGINEFVVSWSDLVLVRGQLHHQAEIQHFLADSGTVV